MASANDRRMQNIPRSGNSPSCSFASKHPLFPRSRPLRGPQSGTHHAAHNRVIDAHRYPISPTSSGVASGVCSGVCSDPPYKGEGVDSVTASLDYGDRQSIGTLSVLSVRAASITRRRTEQQSVCAQQRRRLCTAARGPECSVQFDHVVALWEARQLASGGRCGVARPPDAHSTRTSACHSLRTA